MPFSGVPGSAVPGQFVPGAVSTTAGPTTGARTVPATAYFAVTVTAIVTSAPVEVLLAQSPPARVTAAPVEVLLGQSPPARITSAPVEVAITGSPDARVTAGPVEVLVRVQRLTRTVPATAYFRRQYQIQVPFSAAFQRTYQIQVPFSASFQRTYQIQVPFSAAFSRPGHVPFSASFLRTYLRQVPFFASFGPFRTVPFSAAFLTTPRRSVPFYAVFSRPGTVPLRASFWRPVPTWTLDSDEQSKVMSLASHLVGGSIGSYLGFAAAFTVPAPDCWDRIICADGVTRYDDSWWPWARRLGGGLVPWPSNVPPPYALDFDWRWPNITNDFAPNFGIFGNGAYQGPQQPFDDRVLVRRVFGLPNDAAILRATSAVVQVSALGLFAGLQAVRMNGVSLHNIGYVSPISNAGYVADFDIPSSVLRGGDNVLAIEFGGWLSFNTEGFASAFRITFTYRPPNQPFAAVLIAP